MKINFDNIVSAADQKYDKLELDIPNPDGSREHVVFGNPARLPKEKRDEFRLAVEQMGEDTDDSDEASARIKRLLNAVIIEGTTDKLFEIIGDDQALLSEVLTSYFEALKVGEASPSQN